MLACLSQDWSPPQNRARVGLSITWRFLPVNDDLFAQPSRTTPAHTDEQPAVADQRLTPPQRTCFVCGAQNWQWDEQAHQYVLAPTPSSTPSTCAIPHLGRWHCPQRLPMTPPVNSDTCS